MRTDIQNVLVEQDESIVTLTMNRPDVLNAINTLMLQELTEAVEAAAHIYVVGYRPASLPPS